MAYNRYNRYNKTNFTTTVPGSGCTEKQHELITRLIAEVEAAESSASPETLAAAGNLIDGLEDLPSLLGDQWAHVDRRATSKVIDTLFAVTNLIKADPAVAAAKAAQARQEAAKYPGLPHGTNRHMVTRFDGKCSTCGGQTTAGTDIAASVAGRWLALCLACASADPAAQEAEQQQRLATAMLHPGLHLADGKVWKVDDKGVHARRYGAQFRRILKGFPVLNGDTVLTGDRATAYAAEHGRCIACNENIGHGTERRSLAVGYGPVCAKNYGWPYPTKDEAEQILARRS
jgi:hypothetical protein